MTEVYNVSSDVLKQYILRIERLEQEKADTLAALRDVYVECKSSGFEPKIIRRILKERKMDKDDLDEEETLLVTYKRALGMLPELD